MNINIPTIIGASNMLAVIATGISSFIFAAVFSATWKKCALEAQRQVSETYRASAEAQRGKAIDLERRIGRLEERLALLEVANERKERQLRAARREIEYFENAVRLFVSVKTTLPAPVRQDMERILADMLRGREAAAQELFSWERSQEYYRTLKGSLEREGEEK